MSAIGPLALNCTTLDEKQNTNNSIYPYIATTFERHSYRERSVNKTEPRLSLSCCGTLYIQLPTHRQTDRQGTLQTDPRSNCHVKVTCSILLVN